MAFVVDQELLMNTYIATFFTHYGAIVFQSYCKQRQVTCKLMPVPRFLSSSCGTCVQYEASQWDLGYSHETLDGMFSIQDGTVLRLNKESV